MKEVVEPISFQIEGKQSLKQFLDRYERYFKNKYEGTQ